MLKNTVKYCIFIVILPTLLLGQNNYKKKYIRIAPGVEYKAGSIHEFFFGEHWRDLWVTPINVEILDLEKFANGLTPLKKGGGFQTKSLRLLGKDNNIWKFRSMAKNPAKVLPKVLRETVVADIFQDQISSANPLAALVAAPILEEVGILQAKPILVYMPDSPLLGEFRKDFGNQLGMIEIHPDVDDDENRVFEGADKIESTLDLFERLKKKTDEKIDAKSYLTARLVDLFLGDWDRHTDQWKWARYDAGDLEYWEPIPRDRDQVFAKWDGFGPRIAAYLVPQFVHFDYDYPDIEDITWSGRFIDRRFLTGLTWAEWDSVTSLLVSKLSDKLITNSVRNLPPEHFTIAGEELTQKLISRRNLLNDFSKEYYLMINKVVDIYGTDKDDNVQVDRLNDEETKVVLFNTSKKNKHKNIIFSKKFVNNITKDIRIHLMKGDDKAVVNGEVNSSPLVRIIGGGGKDTLINHSKVNGFVLGILPIPQSESKTEFYDSGKKTFVQNANGTYYNDDKTPKPKDEYEKYEPVLRDRSVDWLPSPVLGFNSNDGFVFGGGAQLYSYNFRMNPYEYWINFTGDYATRPGSVNLNFNGIFNSVIRGTTINLDLHKSELLFTNYYGIGNETEFDKDLEAQEFYRIDEDLFIAEAAINLNYYGNISGNLGINYRTSHLELNNEELLNNFSSDYGLDNFKMIKLFSKLIFDTRDAIYYPRSGNLFRLTTSLTPKLLDIKETYFKAEFEASSYFTLKSITEFIIALKAGGGKTFGNYPLFESVFIGGANSLRGYSRRRFAGDSGIFGTIELRSYLFPLKIIVPGRLGIHNYIETGRVFDKKYSNSEQWHPSYGGGVWVSFVNDAISGSFTVGASSENISYYFNLGMGF